MRGVKKKSKLIYWQCFCVFGSVTKCCEYKLQNPLIWTMRKLNTGEKNDIPQICFSWAWKNYSFILGNGDKTMQWPQLCYWLYASFISREQEMLLFLLLTMVKLLNWRRCIWSFILEQKMRLYHNLSVLHNDNSFISLETAGEKCGDGEKLVLGL